MSVCNYWITSEEAKQAGKQASDAYELHMSKQETWYMGLENPYNALYSY